MGDGEYHALDALKVNAVLKQLIRNNRIGNNGEPRRWPPLFRLRRRGADQPQHQREHHRGAEGAKAIGKALSRSTGC